MLYNYKYTLFGLVILIGFSGCATTSSQNDTKLKVQPIQAYETSKTFESERTIKWPSKYWWESYKDKQLNDLIEEGIKNSPDIALVRARVKEASMYIQATNATLLPSLGVNASTSTKKLSYNYTYPKNSMPKSWNDYGRVGLDLNWEIDFWGKNRAALASATSRYNAMLAEKAQAKLLLSSAIATSYAHLVQLYALKDIASLTLNVKEKIKSLMEERYKGGLDNMVKFHQAQKEYMQLLEEIKTIEESISLNKNQIAALIGKGPDRGLKIHKPSVSIKEGYALPKQLTLNLLGRRPDIVAAKELVKSQLSYIQYQKAKFYPNVNLSAMIGLQSLGLNNLTNSGSDIGEVGPAIYLPIFTGKLLEAQVKEARAGYEEKVSLYNAAVVHALKDVSEVGIQQRSLVFQIQTVRQSLRAVDNIYKIQNNRYKQGLSNLIDLLFAQENVYSVQKNLITLKTQSFILDIAMKRALGGGYNIEENN